MTSKAALLIMLALPLAAQNLTLPGQQIQRDDAGALRWWIETYFVDEADTDQDESVSSAEARNWLAGKLEQAVDDLTYRANVACQEQGCPALTQADIKAREDFEAAKTAREERLRRKRQ